MRNRRSFFKKLSAAFVMLGIGAGTRQVNAAVRIENTLVHHVYFWLKNPGSETDREKLLEGVNTLLDIPEIKLSHVGVPAGTESRDVVDHSYTVSYMAMFDKLEDQNIYQAHPIHLRFVENYAHLWSKVVVYDSLS